MTIDRVSVAGVRCAWLEAGPLMLSLGHGPWGWTVTAWLWHWGWQV